ncbi:MAG TPA: universal stress protein [Solirubrobacterales bacterium]|nr:universal stress protein [Solirubrobacterales bacterium]
MRVLVGFDGSEGARDAVALARILGGEDSEVLLVNVLPYGSPLPVAYSLLGYESPAQVRELFDQARSMLPGVSVETRTYTGDSAAHVLTDLAEAGEADLIVVGSPHRSAVGRTLIGSVAERLLHGASVPIAVAPHGFAARPAKGLDLIAIAYDGTPESKLALRRAEALARAARAKLRVLTVSAPAVPMPGGAGYAPVLGFDAEGSIAEALAAIDPAIETEGRRLAGPPAEAIAQACGDVDLVVSGSRGYGPLGRVFVGSVSSSLICKAPCPVLVVPRSEVSSRDPEVESRSSQVPVGSDKE